MNTYHVVVHVAGGWVFDDIQAQGKVEAAEIALQRANEAFERGDYDFDWDVSSVTPVSEMKTD